ncbi:MAG: preprotein translocase subunit SecG [Betaproteobacteria bacterium]|nr:preprotein translocase subunit SecG [Betaproteobacteria bacterium]
MQQLVLIVHVIAAVVIIGLVLLQHGKGADMGAAFGSGSAGSLFGASGAANFLSRSTAALATVFFLTSMGLTYFSTPRAQSGVIKNIKTEQQAPAATIPAEVPKAEAGKPESKPAESKSNEIPK